MKRKLLLLITLALGAIGIAKAQFYSVSANTAALLTGTADVEASMTLNRNWSLHAGLSVNPWRIEKFRIQHLMVRPEVRWWLSESYRGLFVGAHTLFSGYHIGIPKYMTKKYKGVAWGAGLDVGWAWPISTRWNIEAALGGGWVYADYNILECRNCGEVLGEESRHLFLPTKAGISIVYLF